MTSCGRLESVRKIPLEGPLMADNGEGDAGQFVSQGAGGLIMPTVPRQLDRPALEAGQGSVFERGLTLGGIEHRGRRGSATSANTDHRAC